MSDTADKTPAGAVISGQNGGEHHHYNEIEHSHVLHYEDSPDSSNGFVKIEKPRDLYSNPSFEFGKDNIEITPSDEVAPPTDDDFKLDYAPSPLQFANSELGATSGHESLEQFLASTQKTGSDIVNKGSRHLSDLVGQFSPVEEESASELVSQAMYEDEEEEEEEEELPKHGQTVKDEVVKHMEKVEAEANRLVDHEETTYQRRGPLTLGTPASISSLSHEHHGGLVDTVHDVGSKMSDAAHAVGASLASAGEAVTGKISDAFHPQHTEQKTETQTPSDCRYEPLPPVVTVHLTDVKGKVIDSGKEANDVLEEFASKTATKITNTATDLLDFGTSSPKKVTSSNAQEKSAEGGCCFINLQSLDPRVCDLIHWRDPRKSGVVFGATLAFLICLAIFPVISVAAYTGLIVILGTLSFRLYKMILAFVQKTEQQNPFKPYLDTNLKLPEDRVHQQVEVVVQHIQNLLVQLRRLFLVENVVDTMKFAVLLWALTYVGACLSVMALVIIAFVGLFTIPKFYETYKTQIDHYHGIVHSKVKQACDTIHQKVPQLKSKTHSE